MENGARRDGMLTVKEVAELLHVHPNTLRRWSKDGRIRAYRIAPRGDRRFKQEEITRFLAELNAKAGKEEEAESREPAAVTVANKTTGLRKEPSLAGGKARNYRQNHGRISEEVARM
jgi:excisionase family DNA binding protein